MRLQVAPSMSPQERLGHLLTTLDQVLSASIEQHERIEVEMQRVQALCERLERIVKLGESVVGEGVIRDGD